MILVNDRTLCSRQWRSTRCVGRLWSTCCQGNGLLSKRSWYLALWNWKWNIVFVSSAQYYFFSLFFTDRINDRACRPSASVKTKTSVFSLSFCLLSPSGQVFNSAWETMIKSYNKHNRNISIKWMQVQLATLSQQEHSQYCPDRSGWLDNARRFGRVRLITLLTCS